MKKRIFTGIAIAAIAFAACSDDQNVETTVDNIDGAVQFSSGLPGAQTKITNDNWDLGDAIGVFMLDHGTANIASVSGVNIENREHTAVNGGAATDDFIAVSTPILFGTGTYDFIGYYPYDSANDVATNTTSTINIDVSDQTDLVKLDLLYAKADNSDNGSSGYTSAFVGTIDLPFSHQLSRVVFNVEAGSGLTDTDIENMTITIDALDQDADFSLLTGSLTVSPANNGPLEILQNSANKLLYEGIVLPQSLTQNTVSFDLDGGGTDVLTYDFESALSAFVPGNQYTFNITVSRASLTLTGTIIEPWNDIQYSGSAE